ncbi:hypothetical protein QF027_000260 [Streptomyces canus]|nr:hypothetical protein [Streptomyces canus]
MKETRAVPRVIVTDKLRSYGATHREVMPSVEHRQSKNPNNRAENSHQPTRQRERPMKGFRSVGGTQRFLSAFSDTSPHFRPRRHRMPAHDYRAEMTVRFAIRGVDDVRLGAALAGVGPGARCGQLRHLGRVGGNGAHLGRGVDGGLRGGEDIGRLAIKLGQVRLRTGQTVTTTLPREYRPDANSARALGASSRG